MRKSRDKALKTKKALLKKKFKAQKLPFPFSLLNLSFTHNGSYLIVPQSSQVLLFIPVSIPHTVIPNRTIFWVTMLFRSINRSNILTYTSSYIIFLLKAITLTQLPSPYWTCNVAKQTIQVVGTQPLALPKKPP